MAKRQQPLGWKHDRGACPGTGMRGETRDGDVQARMDRRIEEAVMTLIVPWRRNIGHFVEDVVRSWDTRTIVDRIELAVGKDLQYIRVNGTLVGAAVGCAIFAISELIR